MGRSPSPRVSTNGWLYCAGRGASSGVGFAIPVDSVKGLVEQILKFGRVIRPVLGITIAPPQTVRQLGLEGVLVLEAPNGSPANQAGIKGTFRYAADHVWCTVVMPNCMS